MPVEEVDVEKLGFYWLSFCFLWGFCYEVRFYLPLVRSLRLGGVPGMTCPM